MTSTTAPVITLLTDYGTADEFVGVCHGVIARLCPSARVIDLTHGVTRHDVRSGAAILANTLPYLPVGVHVAVVDPTVGGDRRAIAFETADGRRFVGPDNGLLWLAAEVAGGITRAVEISASPWRLQPTSATFHGRDIFVPVAARLAAGEPVEQAGEPLDLARLVRLELAEPRVEGGALVMEIAHADRFGNVQFATTVDRLGLAEGDRTRVLLPSGEAIIAQLVRTFSDVDAGEALLFEDSARKLALGLNQGSFAGRHGLRAGDELRITLGDG